MGLRAAFVTVSRARWRLNFLLSAISYAACQFVSGPNLADLFGRGDGDEDLLFVQEARVPGQFARQWESRMMARAGALKEAANSELRPLSAYGRSLFCADVKVGDSCKATKRRGAPGRRSTLGPTFQGRAVLRAGKSGRTGCGGSGSRPRVRKIGHFRRHAHSGAG